MSMNLLTMSNEIKNINSKLDILQNINTEIFNVSQITEEIKESLKELELKVNIIYNQKQYDTFKNNKDYDVIYNFLKKIELDDKYISKICFLNCKTLKNVLLTDESIFEKLEIPNQIVIYIKGKIEKEIYNIQI